MRLVHALLVGLSWIEQILQDMEEGRGQASDLERLESHTRLLGPGIRSAPWRPAPQSHCKAASSISATISTATSMKSAAPGGTWTNEGD